jgi:endonuclease/exonuclease/phosphatase family metal-dependent hydrolase
VQHLIVSASGRKYHLINTHLPVTRDEHREAGLDPSTLGFENLLEFIEFNVPREEPAVLAGDFNIEATSPEIREVELAGFRNLCKEYGVRTTRTLYAKNPAQVIDYIFTRNLSVRNLEVSDQLISDHYPLIVTL